MRKKEDIVTKNIVLNPVFYNAAKDVLDEYYKNNVVKRRKEFENNYWALVNILQFVLYRKKPQKFDVVKKYSKYGDEINLNKLHEVSGMRKTEVFLPLMKLFEQKGFIIPIRNERGGKYYTGGTDELNSRATIYYIPLQLVLQMQKYEQEHGFIGECFEIQTSKTNRFYNKKKEEVELMDWVEDAMNSPYGDFRKFNSSWEQIDIVRISDIDYNTEKFLQIAKENCIEQPELYLERCRKSKVERLHGRIFRYGWNHLKKCLRAAIIYHGQEVDVGADYHNADFRMLVILAWMKKEQYNLDESEIERFEADVKSGLYVEMDKWTKKKYGPERIKELLLTFKNATNESKQFYTQFKLDDLKAMKDIKGQMLKRYPTIMNMLMNYKEIQTEDGVKNCLSVHCQNIEGYLMHQFVLPVLDEKFEDPFTFCDAIWIRKSLATKENKDYIEAVFEEQFDNLIECVKHNSFIDNEQRELFKQLIQNLK